MIELTSAVMMNAARPTSTTPLLSLTSPPALALGLVRSGVQAPRAMMGPMPANNSHHNNTSPNATTKSASIAVAAGNANEPNATGPAVADPTPTKNSGGFVDSVAAAVTQPPAESVTATTSSSVTVATTSTAQKQERRQRVLIVDDSSINRRLLQRMIGKEFDICEAENGVLAIAAVTKACEEKRPFDVILMDVVMPVMDGITATQKLREMGIRCCVIALTANVMAHDQQNAFRAGMNALLAKPFSKRDILLLIQSLTATNSNAAPPTPTNDNNASTSLRLQ